MTKLADCGHCGGRPRSFGLYGYAYGYICDDCYDGTPDAGECQYVALASTLEEAAKQWNDDQPGRSS